MPARPRSCSALRDRANLALGFAYLQANQPDKARVPLERVRLNGAYSNKALLGLGWADAALGDYQAALDAVDWSCAAATCSIRRCRNRIWQCRMPSASWTPTRRLRRTTRPR